MKNTDVNWIERRALQVGCNFFVNEIYEKVNTEIKAEVNVEENTEVNSEVNGFEGECQSFVKLFLNDKYVEMNYEDRMVGSVSACTENKTHIILEWFNICCNEDYLQV